MFLLVTGFSSFKIWLAAFQVWIVAPDGTGTPQMLEKKHIHYDTLWCSGWRSDDALDMSKKIGHSIYWLMVSNMCLLSILYGIILPINYYFFRGVKTTNQYLDLIVQWQSMASIWNFSFVAGPDTRAWGKHQHPKSGATLPCDRRAVYKQLRDWYSEATWAQQAGTNCWSDGKI